MTDEPLRVWRIRRNPYWRALAAAPFLISVVGLVGGLLGNPAMFAVIFHGLIFGAAASYMAWQRNTHPRFEEHGATIADGELVVGTERWPVDGFTSGLLVPTQRGWIARLGRGRWAVPVDLGVSGEGIGRMLLSRLGLGGHQSLARFRALSPPQREPGKAVALILVAMIGSMMAGVLAGMLLSPVAFPLFTMLGIAATAVLMAMPQRLDVGADGLRLRWLWRDQFIPLTDLRRVSVDEVALGRHGQMNLVIDRHDGETVVVPMGSSQTDFGRTHAVAARIEWVREMAAESAGDATAQLRREGRTLEAWVAHLRGLEQQATHRRAPVARDALWRTLEDASASPLDRAAAAMALGDRLGDGERRRLSTVARATAAPRLRIALEKVLDEDEAALVDALAALETADGHIEVG